MISLKFNVENLKSGVRGYKFLILYLNYVLCISMLYSVLYTLYFIPNTHCYE
ncbi:MAG: hypothetical protein JWQ25_3037 [Daejeonella sp.]|nr:hypothetical protein [Daejeonella sp.]